MEEKTKEKNGSPEERPSLLFLWCKRMLKAKKEIADHLDNGGDFADLHGRYPFVKPFTEEHFNRRIAIKYGKRN